MDLPNNYKIIKNVISDGIGCFAGCAQPGGAINGKDDDKIINKLQEGKNFEEAGIDKKLLSNLDSIYHEGIRTIYNLVLSSSNENPLSNRNPELLKRIWESSRYVGTTYIMEINGVSTGIEDFCPPSEKQLQLITEDAVRRIHNGEHILVHCQGGMGRTGTVLAAIYMKLISEHNYTRAIEYIRSYYHQRAIETISQIESLKIFGEVISQ